MTGGERRTIRIFLSSPGDVTPERLAVEMAVRRLDAELQAAGTTRLELIRWEENWYSAESHFQDQLPLPSSCELVVCIFWKRLGSELPDRFQRPDGSGRSGSEWEFEEALESARQDPDKLPDILVYRKSAKISFEEETVDLERAQKRALDGFWNRWFRSEEGQFLAAFKHFPSTESFAQLFERDLRRWLDDRHRRARWSVALQGSPYRGLLAFDERHGEVFFGRRRAVEQARARLIATGEMALPALFVIGMSGAGKSSLLRAGLLPRLLQPGATPGIDRWRSLVVTPAALGNDPLSGLAAAMLGQEALPELAASDFGTPAELQRFWSEATETAARPILSALDRVAAEAARSGGLSTSPITGLLLAVDQLEECFAWPAELRRRFARLLQALVVTRRVWLLATLRSDFYPQLQADAALLALKEGGRGFDLALPSAAEIREIIEGPAEAAGLAFERDGATGETLAERLETDAAGGSSLPLLQFALAELFEAREAATGLLRWESYRALGGLPGAMEARAEATLRALPASTQQALPRLLFALATVEGESGREVAITAGTLPLAKLDPGSEQRRLADALVAARLLNAEGDGAGARLRVAHEALFTHWGRAREILAASRADLALAAALRRQAQAWQLGGRSPDDLLRGVRLLQAEELLRRRAGELGFEAETQGFIAQSGLAARQAQRRRKRGLIASFTALAVLSLAAIGFGLHALRQEQVAEAARIEAEHEREAAEHSLDVAIRAVETLVTTTSEELSTILGVPQSRILGLLQQAEVGLDALSTGDTESPALQAARARLLNAFAGAYLGSGDLTTAGSRAEQAVSILRTLAARDPGNGNWQLDLAESLSWVGDVKEEKGDLVGALAAFEEALAINRALVALDPGNSRWQRDLGVSLGKVGGVKEAQGDLAGALSAYEERIAISRALVALDPSNSDWQRELSTSVDMVGGVRKAQGDLAGALAAFQESLAISRALVARDPSNGRWQRDLGASLNTVGAVKQAQGDLAGAQAAFEESLAIRRMLVARDPTNSAWQRDLGFSLSWVGSVKEVQGDLAGALADFEECLAISRALVARDPSNSGWQSNLGVCLNRIGSVKEAQGDLAGALAAFEESLAISRTLVGRDPSNSGWQRDLSVSLDRVGSVKMNQHDLAGALAAFEEALAISRALAVRDPSNAGWQSDLGASLRRVGSVKEAQGDLAGALAVFEEALAINRALVARDPSNVDWQSDLSIGLNRVGGVKEAQGDFAGALAAFEESLAIRRTLAARDPSNGNWQRDLTLNLERVGGLKQVLGDLEGALAAFEESLAIHRTLAARDPDHGNPQSDLGTSLNLVGGVKQAQGDLEGALAAFEESLAISRALVARDQSNTDWQRQLGESLNRVGWAKRMQGDLTGALTAFEESLRISRALVARDPSNRDWLGDLILSLTLVGLTTGDAGPYREALDVLRALDSQGGLGPEQQGWKDFIEARLAELAEQ